MVLPRESWEKDKALCQEARSAQAWAPGGNANGVLFAALPLLSSKTLAIGYLTGQRSSLAQKKT